MNLSDLTSYLLPETALLLAALVIIGVSVALAGKARCDAITSLLATAGILAAIVLSSRPLTGADTTGAVLYWDALGRVVRPWLFALALPALLLAPGRRQLAFPAEFKALVLFALAGLSLAACARHLLLLFIGLELAGLSFYLLVAFPRTRQSADAAIRYFLFGGIAAAFLLFGCSLVYGFVPSLEIPAIAAATSTSQFPLFATLGLLMILAGLLFKLAAAPFHYWAPDVYQKAPIPAVLLIAGASKLTALVAMVRLLHGGFSTLAGSAAWGAWRPGWSLWLAVIAAVAMILGNILALGQSSVRRLLAYSAVANAGYALVGVIGGGQTAMATAINYIILYGIATIGALIVTANVEARTGNDSITSFSGLWKRSPGEAIAMIFFMGSLAGLPPLAGFAGKFALFASALADGGTGLAWLVAIAVIMSAVSLYYYLGVLRRVMESSDTTDTVREPLDPGNTTALFITSAGTLILGIFPSLILSPLMNALSAAFQ